jgi:histidyl-tRNA synthetase
MKLQTPRGTRDIFAQEAVLFREIESTFCQSAKLFDFQEIETPIFEFTEVFKRTLGDQSDIVNKEMYTFIDRSGDSLTLRPEGTASVARAVVSNSMLRDLPLKLFYSGPMFRHERPQKGRYRQFRQFGIELIGIDQPLADIEVIACAWHFLKQCGLSHKVKLEINTIGDLDSRNNFTENLKNYLNNFKDQLSADSQNRLQTNPLRILDSKDDADKKILENAPTFNNFLNTESKSFFNEVLKGLDLLKIPYHINTHLVRGLDYYNHSVFEFTTEYLGSQNAVLSGGRYNNLIEQMGGPSTPGVGWAAGTDRLALLMENPQAQAHSVGIITNDDNADSIKIKMLAKLRDNGIAAQALFSGNISKQMKKAHKRNCSHVIIIGENELNNQTVTLKNLKTGEQFELLEDKMLAKLRKDYGLQ